MTDRLYKIILQRTRKSIRSYFKEFEATKKVEGRLKIVVFDELSSFMVENSVKRPHEIILRETQKINFDLMLSDILKENGKSDELVFYALPWTIEDSTEDFLAEVSSKQRICFPKNVILLWQNSKDSELLELSEKINKKMVVLNSDRTLLSRWSSLFERDVDMAYGLMKSKKFIENLTI